MTGCDPGSIGGFNVSWGLSVPAVDDMDEVTVIPKQSERVGLPQEGGDRYYCRVCGALITTGGDRTEIDGGHAHTFVNPAGYIFRIGCFRSAPGCLIIGEPTREYSWFAGRFWRLAACALCTTHLGWAYGNGETREFFGLILDRLRRGEGN